MLIAPPSAFDDPASMVAPFSIVAAPVTFPVIAPPVELEELGAELEMIAPPRLPEGPRTMRSRPTVRVIAPPVPVPVRFSAKSAPPALTVRSRPTLKAMAQALVRPESSLHHCSLFFFGTWWKDNLTSLPQKRKTILSDLDHVRRSTSAETKKNARRLARALHGVDSRSGSRRIDTLQRDVEIQRQVRLQV